MLEVEIAQAPQHLRPAEKVQKRSDASMRVSSNVPAIKPPEASIVTRQLSQVIEDKRGIVRRSVVARACQIPYNCITGSERRLRHRCASPPICWAPHRLCHNDRTHAPLSLRNTQKQVLTWKVIAAIRSSPYSIWCQSCMRSVKLPLSMYSRTMWMLPSCM